MAARDNVIYYASVSNGVSAGTKVPLSLLYGVENVRAGYGTPKLKNVRAVYQGLFGVYQPSPFIEIKNSNWVDSAGLRAPNITYLDTFSRNSLGFMRGRDKVLAPNTSWTIEATMPVNTTVAGFIYVILEIEYDAVPGKPSADLLAGSPVVKRVQNNAVTAAANVPTSIGSFDNLLQGVSYVLSEVSGVFNISTPNVEESYCKFMILEGFSNQRGLIRIIPVRMCGMAEQIEGSVELTKQTYNIGIICGNALSNNAVDLALEMIASSN